MFRGDLCMCMCIYHAANAKLIDIRLCLLDILGIMV